MRRVPPSLLAPLCVAGAVTGLCLLVLWAAAVGPADVLSGEGREPQRLSPSPTESATPVPEDPIATDRATREGHPLVDLLIGVLQLLAIAVAGYLLWRLARWGYRAVARPRWRLPDRPARVEFDVLPAAEAVAAALAEGAAEQRELLEAGEPRDAIVACWHRFEQIAADAGIPRDPWETSAEFTLRILDLAETDSGAATALAALYREARFSGHHLGESERRLAREALDALHRSLEFRLVVRRSG